MIQLHEHVGARLRTFGRCAMMGSLIGLMTTQAFAASAPMVTSQPTATPETTTASTDATQAIATAPTTNLQLTTADNSQTVDAAVPEAPIAPEEQASVTKPIDIRAVMDDAAQNTQNLQSTTTQQKQHHIHPGWLAVTAIGVGMFAFGIIPLTASSTRGKPIAGAFVGVGAGLSGLGLYLTFK